MRYSNKVQTASPESKPLARSAVPFRVPLVTSNPPYYHWRDKILFRFRSFRSLFEGEGVRLCARHGTSEPGW